MFKNLNGFPISFLALFAAFLSVFITQNLSGVQTASTKVHGDGIYYYAYYRSLVFDRDLDFKNDYKLLGDQYRAKKAKTGKMENAFSIGPTLFWIPFTPLAFVTDMLEQIVTGKKRSIDGSSMIFQRTVQAGSLIWGFVALFLIGQLAKRKYGSIVAFGVVSGLILATPLGWYTLRQASYSHAIGAFSVTAFVYYFLKTSFKRSLKQWGLLGFFLGLSMLVRVQNITHATLPFVQMCYLAITAFKHRDSKHLKHLAKAGILFCIAAFVTFLPQMLAWNSIYGSLFTMPQEHLDQTFMYWSYSRWVPVLFSGHNGLFAWHPLIYLSVLGLVTWLFKPDSGIIKSRLIPAAMLVSFALQVYVNGATLDWWGGWAFGGRRFLSCTIYFGLGLAIVLYNIPPFLKWLGKWIIPASPILFVLIFIIFNLGLMSDYRHNKITPAGPQNMQQNWKRTINNVFDKAYKITGNWGAIPANLAFAAKAGVSPAHYDLIGGMQFFFKKKKKEVILFNKSPLAIRGFGKIIVKDKKSGRSIDQDEALLILPIRKPCNISAELFAYTQAQNTTLNFSLSNTQIQNSVLKPGWQKYRFSIPAQTLSCGLNFINIKKATINKTATTPKVLLEKLILEI